MSSQSRVTRGRIADRPIAELFDSIYETGRTGVAHFRTALGTASVWFHDGELIDAEMGRFLADAAVLRLLKIRDGEFEIELGPVERPRAMKMATVQLLAHGRQQAARPGRGAAGITARRRPASTAQPRAAKPAPAQPSGGPQRRPDDTDARTVIVGNDADAPRRVVESPPIPPSGARPAAATPVIGGRPATGARPSASPHPASRPAAARPAGRRPEPSERPATSARAGGSVGAPPSPAGRPAPRPSAEPARPTTPSAPASRQGAEDEPTIAIPKAAVRRALERKPAASWNPVESSGDSAHKPSPAAPKRNTQFMFRDPPAGPTAPAPSPPAAASSAPSGRPAPEPESEAAATLVAGRIQSPSERAPSRPSKSAASDFVDKRTRPAATAKKQAAPARAPVPTPPPASPSHPVASGRRPPSGGSPKPAAAPSPPAGKPAVGGWTFGTPKPEFIDDDEPETLDRTLMRPGPVPPPRDPVAPAGSTPSAAPAATPIPGVPFAGAPEIIDEEYSHPISVPSDPTRVGPGGTMMLGAIGSEIEATVVAQGPRGPSSPLRPLPEDSTAHQTVVLHADDVEKRRQELAGTGSGASPQAGSAHVGRYEVLLRLARGGMGTIYLCRVTGEGGFRRLFALKVIREHLNSNRAYVEMLLEEARIASRLNHPNVVPILDIDIFAGQHYLVMDYVEGCTFSELLKLHPQARPPQLIIPIIIDALTGLHAAHTMLGDSGAVEPLVHCDVSPQNMLVGINGTCRLIDFGVARASNSLPQSGKPRYLSPEQVHGMPVDPRSDVFAIGVVLWNALTGELLFDGETPEQIMQQVANAKIPPPSTVGLRPPAAFDRICLRALERNPARRYQTAEQMLVDLRKVAIADDLVAPSSSVGQWVMDSFGHQIELRRQAAGMGSDGLGGLGAAAGPSGHADHHDSAEAEDLDASRTMMLRAPPLPGAEGAEAAEQHGEDDDEGMGPRAKVVVLIAAFAFMVAAGITLWVAPELLEGGYLDEYGEYVEGDEIPYGGGPAFPSTDGLPPVGGSQGAMGTGLPTDEGDTDSDGADTDGDTQGDTDGETEGETEAETDDEPKDDPKGGKGKGGKGKGKGGKGKGGKGKGGKGKKDDKPKDDKPKDDKPKDDKPKDDKPKGDGGEDPVDLENLFRPPGG